ncbi:MAG: class I SAM-dependent methyltransferase [Mailhella sp.]|nr:class I SAM-dependent methyltransferase [Mailhella sp.]
MKEAGKLTLDYYNEKARAFCDDTQDVEFSAFQRAFTSHIPEGGRILDLGCGSGRDSRAFLNAGYQVTAVDGSVELCRIASEFIGQPVLCATFQDYVPAEVFDGIWACASLLHIPSEELEGLMARLAGSLRRGGCFYVSFKYGDFRGMRNGRFFQDMTEDSLRELLKGIPELEVVSMKITGDVRPGREKELWLNVLLKKA